MTPTTLMDHTVIDRFDANSVIVDLGANKGEFASLFSKTYSFQKMILVEANPSLIADIEQNIGATQNVAVLNAVIGTSDQEEAVFFISDAHDASSINEDFSKGTFAKNSFNTNAIKQRMLTLESLMEEYAIDKIDFLKVDIEGAEWDLIESFTPALCDKIDQISVEFHDFYGEQFRPKSEKCIKKLKDMGYQFTCKGTDFEQGSPYFDCLFYKE